MHSGVPWDSKIDDCGELFKNTLYRFLCSGTEMVYFEVRCPTRGKGPVIPEGLAREGNLDILVPWA